MIELYTANTPNGKKISIMLEEIGFKYNVNTIDLNKGEATIYDFKNVGSLLQNYNFDVKYNVSTDGDMPTIIIEERETNQRLIQFRAMYQNKR